MSFKKRNIIIILFLAALLLSCCSVQQTVSYTEYPLYRALLDGEEITCEAGKIMLDGSGSGFLVLGDRKCDIVCDGNSVTINSLNSEASFEENNIVLTMGDTGLVYYFGTEKNEAEESGPESQTQKEWSGNWRGRMYFSTCSGKWEEYEGRTIILAGNLKLDMSNEGSLELFGDVYSSEYPAVSALFLFGEKGDHCSEGYVFGYKAGDGAISIERTQKLPSEINNTEFVNPHEYEWYVEEETEEEIETPVDVLLLAGNCRDDEGAFNYRIELRKEP